MYKVTLEHDGMRFPQQNKDVKKKKGTDQSTAKYHIQLESGPKSPR